MTNWAYFATLLLIQIVSIRMTYATKGNELPAIDTALMNLSHERHGLSEKDMYYEKLMDDILRNNDVSKDVSTPTTSEGTMKTKDGLRAAASEKGKANSTEKAKAAFVPKLPPQESRRQATHLHDNNVKKLPQKKSMDKKKLASLDHSTHLRAHQRYDANFTAENIGATVIVVTGIVMLAIAAYVVHKKHKRQKQRDEDEKQMLKSLLDADMDYAAM